MTGPAVPLVNWQTGQGAAVPMPDFAAQFGPTSQMYQDELTAFNASRDQFLSQLFHAIQPQQQPSAVNQPAQTPAMTRGLPMLQQPAQAWKDEDLVGAATYWGIPEEAARAMPRNQLIDIVQKFRTDARAPEQGFAAAMGRAATEVAAIPAMFSIGAGESITGGLGRLPIIGEALGRLSVVHAADQFLRRAEESIRASTPADFQWVNSGANIAGNLATLWFPAAGAWSLAGKAGAALPWVAVLGQTAGPIARVATQGSLAGILLAGKSVLPSFGGDRGAYLQTMTGHALDPENRAEMADAVGVVAGGAALPMAWEALSPALGALATRVTRGFVGPDMLGPGSPTALEFNRQGPRLPEGFGVGPQLGPEQNQSMTQLMQLAAQGDQQASEMLDFIHGHPSGTTFSRNQPVSENVQRMQNAGMPSQLGPANILDPEEWIARAGNLAAQMNKAATIVQSPSFAEDAGRTILDETTVAHAAQATNPGGTNIISGISDPAQFIAGIAQDQHLAFARRGDRLDAILSDEPITHDMVRQYEKHGFYEGQRVMLPEGLGGTVSKIQPDGAWVQPIYHNVPHFASYDQLHPWFTSPGSREVPEMWDAFNAYANDRTLQTSQAMGGAITPEQLSSVRTQNLQQYMQDFFADTGIDTPAQQARIRTYFNQRYVSDIKATEPEASAIQDALVAQAQALPKPEPTPTNVLDRAAAAKGFVAIPQGDDGWTIKDMGNFTTGQAPSQISFSSMEAAQEWVTKINRELPDITPQTQAVPLEVQAQHPTEPTQGPNLNEQTPRHIVNAIADMETAAGPEAGVSGSGSEVPAAIQEAADGNLGRLKNRFQRVFMRTSPARRLMSQLDQIITEGQAENGQLTQSPGFAQDYDLISNAQVIHHNDQHPWFDRATDALKPVKTSRLVDGSFTRVYEIVDDAARIKAAQDAGFSAKEMQALDDVHSIIADLFKESGLDPNREIKQYIAHIAQRQSDPELLGRAFEDFPLTPTTKPFYEYMRTGNLNARELDTRELLDASIRAVTWQKNMAEPFNATVAKWQALTEDPALKPAAEVMQNWLKVVRYGYHANDDTALEAMHFALKLVMGPEVTRQQARELFNFGLNSTHTGLLGYRFNVMARDAQQFMLAIPRAGADLLRVMKDYSTSSEARQRILADALDAGAVSLQMPRMTAPGSFAGDLEQAGLSDAGEAARPQQSDLGWRMRAAGKVMNAVRDLTPGFLQDTRDTPLHPLYFYGKQSEIMKSLVFTAGRDKAARAIDAFRAGGSIDMEALMGESAARTFDPAWQRQFQQLVGASQDKDAASFLGRQLADATQFKYGVTESPWAAKSLTGRVALQFGNYSMQYFQFLRESLALQGRSPSAYMSDTAKLLMLAGGTTAAMEAASQATSWNFRYMNPWFGLGVSVGPWVGLTATIAKGAGSAIQAAYGAPPTQGGQSNIAAAGQALEQAASMMNPLGGIFANAQAAGQAIESPYPGLAELRYQLTGDMSQTPDIDIQQGDVSRSLLQQSMQPMHGPVRASGFGTTQIPPFAPVYPPELTGGRAIGARPDTSAIPFAPPSAGTASVYQYQDVDAALHGDQNARRFFAPDELHMLDSLQGVPHDIAIQAFRDYMNQKIGRGTAGSNPTTPNTVDTGGRSTSSTPQYPQGGPPGGGNFF